ncbi:DUF397 domain-containing protein [Nocardia callitridis]|uniref:DUF397 domain-containing protein n=1 Tax=Nocardia callitridis TaxID=648753 RepID=A0ABP9L1G6_9NOCA
MIDLTGARWIKSSYSETGGQCVEVAFLDESVVGVRDSKDPAGPALVVPSRVWAAFTAGVARGAFGS